MPERVFTDAEYEEANKCFQALKGYALPREDFDFEARVYTQPRSSRSAPEWLWFLLPDRVVKEIQARRAKYADVRYQDVLPIKRSGDDPR